MVLKQKRIIFMVLNYLFFISINANIATPPISNGNDKLDNVEPPVLIRLLATPACVSTTLLKS